LRGEEKLQIHFSTMIVIKQHGGRNDLAAVLYVCATKNAKALALVVLDQSRAYRIESCLVSSLLIVIANLPFSSADTDTKYKE
jgi:glucosamine 6-phosphate synthetase-like amidotransferase/phosphosugar isomerase protein